MEIIKQLEARRYQIPTRRGEGFNDGIDTAIKLLRSQTVIKAKVLRKRGTNLYYFYDSYLCEYCPDEIPIPFTGDFDNAKNNDEYFPEDAELIDIEIIIPKE